MTHQQRQQRLARIGEYAQQEEDKAARQMAEASNRLAEQEQRLCMLEDYQREYAARLSFNPGASSRVFALQNYRAFMARIDEAVAQQKQVVERMRQEHERLSQNWQLQRARSRGLQKIQDKVSLQIVQKQNRRDQFIQDEFALRVQGSMSPSK